MSRDKRLLRCSYERRVTFPNLRRVNLKTSDLRAQSVAVSLLVASFVAGSGLQAACHGKGLRTVLVIESRDREKAGFLWVEQKAGG